MRRLETAPEIIRIAVALKLDPERGAVNEILRHCHERIARFLSKSGGAKTLDQLQAHVAKALGLVFEEVWSDEDLIRITKKYVALGEPVFASLPMQLEEDTFATMMEREHVQGGAADRYVAVIDCRGEKGARRYFTRWHEIAHLLAPTVRQLELPFVRVQRSSVTKQDPVERLMDKIAGDVGFYTPLFEPALKAELDGSGALTFDGVQRVRDQVCPVASFHATLIACVNRSPIPTILLEAAMGYKKAEARAVLAGQMSMFASTKPQRKLRAVTSTQNPAARASGFVIHQNMSIPAASLVAKQFDESELAELSATAHGDEELSIWRHSTGEPVGYGPVHVETRRTGGTFFALIQQPHRQGRTSDSKTQTRRLRPREARGASGAISCS